MILFYILLSLLAITASLSVRQIKNEINKNTFLEQLPSTLFLAATSPSTSARRVVEEIANEKQLGLIAREFRKAHNLLTNGAPLSTSLAAINTFGSTSATRAINAISLIDNSPASKETLVQIAEHLTALNSLRAETSAALSTNKHSLFLSVGFIVPFILSTLTSMPLLAQNNTTQLLPVIQASMLISCGLTGLLAAMLDNVPKRALLYALLLATCTQLVQILL